MQPEQDLGFRYRAIQRTPENIPVEQRPPEGSVPVSPIQEDMGFRSRPIQPANIEKPVAKKKFKPGLTYRPEYGVEDIPRVVSQFASRGAEAIASLPRTVAELGLSQRPGFDEDMYTAPGRRLPKERAEDAEKEREILSNLGIKNSEELKEFSEKLTGGYTKPQSEKEEFLGNVVSDLTSAMLPVKGKLPFLKSTAAALAGESAKEIMGAFGGGETSQNLAKMGTMILTGAINPNGAKKQVDQWYEKSRKLLPANASTNAGPLGARLSRIKRELSKGKGANLTEKKQVIDTLDQIMDKFDNNKIKVEELVEFKKDIYKMLGDYETAKGAKNQLKYVNKLLDTEISRYGKAHNPEFLAAYKDANSGFAGLAQSKKISKALETVIKDHKKLTGSLGLGGGIIASMFGLLTPTMIAKGLGSYSALKLGELGYRAVANPTLRNYYINLIKESAKGNSANAAKILEKFNEKLAEEEPKVK